ncbi:MAG: cytochrome c3 family protein [Fidelibacterota bacterium]|nr:MAG: cytochrome c3 family protein [Candidatus Neomarinimicrobiota bacterium]
MKRHLLLIPVLITYLGTARAQTAEESSCVGCHLEQDPPFSTPAEQFVQDIHGGAGFGCHDCHGGDPEAWDYDEAKDPAAGFIGAPSERQIVELCGKCHNNPDLMRRYNPNLPTDQTAKYWTSGHGNSLRQGNHEVAQCASCHGAHGIKRSTDPGSPVYHANVAATCAPCHADERLMAKFKLPSNTVHQYVGSVHGIALLERGDVAAPTCNNCHGNHGAAPPEVGSIQEVCGVCHINNQTLFNASKMFDVFSEQGLHGCVVCHTAHDIQHLGDDVISVSADGVCGLCHTTGDAGALQAENMLAVLDSLSLSLEQAASSLHEADNRGLEVEELHLDLQTANTSLVQTRTMVHTFDAQLMSEEAEPGLKLAAQIVQSAQQLLHEFRMRKIGLGIATVLISFLALVLYLYIRTLD